MTTKNKTKKQTKTTSAMAKSDDGSVQITFTIPFDIIDKQRDIAIAELAKDIEVPGFRKGKAPTDRASAKIPAETLVEKTLSAILPKLITDAIGEYKLKPAVYPKFELIKAQDKEPWQVRAKLAEIPEFELGDYKKSLKGALKAKTIWTPGKGDPKEEETKNQEMSPDQKDQEVMKILLETVKIKVPAILVEEEVNSKLSQLLERIEKLGLTLESYLASLGKTADTLRGEYGAQAEQALKLEFILAKVAESEKITVSKKQIDDTINVSKADPEMAKKLDTPEQRRVIESVLRRRGALDKLITLL